MTERKFNLIKKNQWTQGMKLKEKPYVITTSHGKTITFIIVIWYLILITFKRNS